MLEVVAIGRKKCREGSRQLLLFYKVNLDKYGFSREGFYNVANIVEAMINLRILLNVFCQILSFNYYYYIELIWINMEFPRAAFFNVVNIVEAAINLSLVNHCCWGTFY